MGGRVTVCLYHVVLGDYIIHIFYDKMHMGRNVLYLGVVCLSYVVLGDCIIHIFYNKIHM